jgi:nicotinamidase-related amidase
MKRALMVIDVQPVFLSNADFRTIDGDDLVEKCKALIDRAHAADVPVIYVRHADEDDMPEGTNEDAKQFHPDLAPRLDEPTIDKIFGSGFMETDLDDVLRSKGIECVVACGLSTYGCVNQTVLFAKLYGYDVAVVGNAHAGQNSTEFPVSQGIPIFHRAWEKAGIRVLVPDNMPF